VRFWKSYYYNPEMLDGEKSFKALRFSTYREYKLLGSSFKYNDRFKLFLVTVSSCIYNQFSFKDIAIIGSSAKQLQYIIICCISNNVFIVNLYAYANKMLRVLISCWYKLHIEVIGHFTKKFVIV
jgi:hypothetical protein